MQFVHEIPEDDRLTVAEKTKLAAEHSELNAMLAEKRQLEADIAKLVDQANALRKRANEVDYAFHKKALEVRAEQLKPIGTKRPPTDPLVRLMMEKLKTNPELLDNPELRKLLGDF